MSIKTSHPVKDLRGKAILEANEDALEWAKRTAFSNEYLKKKAKIKDMAQLMDDLSSVFEHPTYKPALQNWVPSFREWVGELWAPAIILEEMKLHRIRDPYSYQHVLIIGVIGARLLELWIKTQPTVKRAFQAFLFHDLGKSRIAPAILDKGETLMELEKRAIYDHPIASFALNAAYWGDPNHLCADVALNHHEDRLGKGYPQGTKTNSLILDILGTVDRFDALITDRPFRFKKFTQRQAFDVLKKDVDMGKIEPDVLKALVALIRREKITDLKKIKLGTIGRESAPAKST
jgi:HD-GYP domain-containing protein (c-di-GMP phosphodiesterase class II)